MPTGAGLAVVVLLVVVAVVVARARIRRAERGLAPPRPGVAGRERAVAPPLSERCVIEKTRVAT